MNNDKIFDLPILQGLYDALGKDKLAELVEGFLSRTDEIVIELQSPKTEGVYEKAHELKGMAANYGFAELSVLAKELEDIIKDDQPLEAQIEKLSDANQRAHHAIKEWLDSKVG